MRTTFACPALALVALLSACNDKGPAIDTGPFDRDQDGITASEDCDDGNAIVGLAETWYLDGDEDGYGDPDTTVESCSQPAGYLDNAEDCGDDTIYQSPIAVEKCDSLDNDCDGETDEDDARDVVNWYADEDEDGFGDQDTTVLACDAPDGWLEDGSDCDDADEDVHPGVCEICGDNIDNDCDGVEVCDALNLVDFVAYGVGAGDALGYNAKGVGDIDGDGLDDVLIGSPYEDADGEDAGAAYLIAGRATGAETLDLSAAARLGGGAASLAGTNVSGGGDIDGDGYGDLIVGAPGDGEVGTASGAVGVWYGPVVTGGWGSAGASVQGAAESDALGRSVAWAGDVDGDGNDDIFASAPGEDSGSADGGAVYVFFGPTTGAVSASAADSILLGSRAGQALGEQITGLGDLDGDGFDDLLFGLDGATSTSRQTGAVYLWYGPPDSGTLDLNDLEVWWFGDNTGSVAAHPSSVGDLNQDGLADFAVLASGDSEGAGSIYIWYGAHYTTFDTMSEADAKFDALSSDNRLSLPEGGARFGDFDGDGADDILFGDPGDDSAGTDAGAAYVLLGPFEGSYDLCGSDVQFFGEAAGDLGGALTSGAGDFNGDGRADLLIGAAGNDQGGDGAGAAYIKLAGDW